MSAVGEPIYETQVLRDNAQVPITGLTALSFETLEAFTLPDATRTADVTVTELGGGKYSFGFIPTAIATWAMHVRYNVPPVSREYESTHEVDSAALVVGAGPTITGIFVTGNLVNVRRAIQRLLGDLIILTATADGSTQTIEDDVDLFDSNNSYVGSHLRCVTGNLTNVDKLARCDGSTQSVGTLSFTPAFPNPVLTGDVLDLHNLHGQGWRDSEIVETINAKLRASFPSFLLPADADLTNDGTTATVFELDAPNTLYVHNDLTHVFALTMLDDDGNVVEIPPAYYSFGDFGFVALLEPYATAADGKMLTARGYMPHPEVSAGTDPIYLDQDWLIKACAADLGSQITNSGPRNSWAMEWKRSADARANLLLSARKNNTQPVVRAR